MFRAAAGLLLFVCVQLAIAGTADGDPGEDVAPGVSVAETLTNATVTEIRLMNIERLLELRGAPTELMTPLALALSFAEVNQAIFGATNETQVVTAALGFGMGVVAAGVAIAAAPAIAAAVTGAAVAVGVVGAGTTAAAAVGAVASTAFGVSLSVGAATAAAAMANAMTSR